MTEARQLFVNGAWQEAIEGVSFSTNNPATGEVHAQIADAARADAAVAVDAAANAFVGWSSLNHVQRSRHLSNVANMLESRQLGLADHLVKEGGAWFGKGMFESGYVPNIFRAAAAATYNAIGEILPSEHGKFSMAVRQPLGVISVISPWNFPLLLSSRGIAFALAAGNTIVLKPSEETPISGGLVLAEAFEEAGVPPGVLNVVTCSRDHVSEVGDEMLSNTAVRGISFTGSTAVGRQLASKAGSLLKRCCLELGGKDALIVLQDADLDRAVNAAAFGSFMHQGQICMSIEKVIVHRSLADELTQRLAEKARALQVGDPSADKANIIGPIINQVQLDKISAQVEDAVAQGASIEAGGGHQGLFFEPTVLSGVTPKMSVFREETFGPVAPVIVCDDDDEAIALANDTEYGLSAGIISRDEERALGVANRLQTGMCHINDAPVFDEPHVPFGGTKNSGLGRHGGRWAIETFSETRWITLERGGRQYPF